MKTIARCGIYETRPQCCIDYPKVEHWTPEVCTYSFPYGDARREGECACELGACCATPREGGEPGGAPIPEAAGGTQCKHLVWEDVEEEEPKEKIASLVDASDLLRIVQ